MIKLLVAALYKELSFIKRHSSNKCTFRLSIKQTKVCLFFFLLIRDVTVDIFYYIYSSNFNSNYTYSGAQWNLIAIFLNASYKIGARISV